MKTSTGVFFTLLLFMVSCTQKPSESAIETVSDPKEIVLTTIHNRKSVRSFKDKPVAQDDLLTLVKAGMAAPSAVNKQPWHFVIVNERQKLDQLADQLAYAKMLKDVSAAIVVCGDTSIHVQNMRFWVYDCSAASQNILLAAESMGLGAVWTAVYPVEERMHAVKELLRLPAEIIPLNVIPVGYPTGEDKPQNKYREEKVHLNGW